MKKFFVLLLVVCLAFAGLITYISYSPMPIADEAELTETPAYEGETGDAAAEDSADEAAAAEEAAPSYLGLDYQAILDLHEEEDIFASMGDRDVTWREYFYWLFVQASQMDNYLAQMNAYYGMEADWNAAATDDMSIAELAVENAEFMISQVQAIEDFAKANNVELNDEDKAAIAEQLAADMESMLGEGADEETFNEYLLTAHLNRDIYDRLNAAEYLTQRSFSQLYGQQGEKVEEADAVAYLEENGYINASHILFMTIDPTTGEALDDAAKAEKLEQAQALAEELAAIEDSAELVERFGALKQELCEDTGKVNYPDGYTFTPGTMVPEFEEACLALDSYKVSDVVETSYGYHVIMRLPLSGDAGVLTSDGSASTGRLLYANKAFTESMSEAVEARALEYAEGFEYIDLSLFVRK